MWWLESRLENDEKGQGHKKWVEFVRSLNRPPPEAFRDPRTAAKYRALRAAEPQ